ncbi:peptide methionine sulfoxide reductase [Cryomyces antarcticus]
MAFTMPSLMSRLFRPFSSQPMRFNPETAAQNYPEGSQKCTLAAGCFWGVEHMYRHTFANKGLIDARVGYIGGDSKNPSYRAVCSGRTGHAEALQIIFDPSQLSYKALLEFFYKMHDPTTSNRQGPDTGSQYRSAIFYHDEEQEKIARDVTKQVQDKWWTKGKVVTEILPAGEWWDAEDYHQRYLDVNPGGYECPSHFLRKFPPLEG